MLLEDELPSLKYLKMLCEQIDGLEVVKAFNNVDQFLGEISTLDYDLCILDIEMPGMNGLHVANLLNGKPVIFTTAYKDYAADAFELDAVDYIRKPVKKERLQMAIKKASTRILSDEQPRKFIQLNSEKGKALLFFDQLNYIVTSETDSRDKIAYLNDDQRIVLKNISYEKLLDYLPGKAFCRVNKREIIALRCVQYFAHDEITTTLKLSSGKPIMLTLGDAYRSEFLKKVHS